MQLILGIAQGVGLSCAVGVRPFIAGVAVNIFASEDFFVNFSGTDYAFLESSTFLVVMIALLVITGIMQRRMGPETFERGPLGAAMAGVGIGLGAIFFAASLADFGYTSWPGLIAGILCAALAQVVSRGVFAGAAARLDKQARKALVFYKEWTVLILAVLAMVIPPISYLFLAFLIWLFIANRRRKSDKYAGLRILR